MAAKETTTHRMGDYVPGYTPPLKDLVRSIVAVPKAIFSPTYSGWDNVDRDRPALYVTNHSAIGLLDGTLWVAEIYLEKDIFTRPLVDNMHYNLPGWRDIGEQLGGFVRGTRENCLAMMKAGEHIVVYPGGGRETCKRKGEKYSLTWKKRTGFASMAIEMGYDIVPVAQVGPDDSYDILLDANDLMKSPLGEWLKERGILDRYLKGGDSIPPLVRGIGPTLIPRPEKHYYAFGERISTKEFAGREKDEEALWEVRNMVETRLEILITKLRIKKIEDGDDNPLRAFLNRL